MSLQETTIIQILDRLRNETLNIDEWPKYYYDMIQEYINSTPEELYNKSVSKNQFQLADYFFNQISDDDKLYQIYEVIHDQALYNNMRGIEYLISRFKYQDEWENFYNSGLQGATTAGNLTLINWFIDKGATSMDRGLLAAVETNNTELIQFFIERGANDWQSALESAVYTNNTTLVNYFMGLLGDNLSYQGPLSIAVYRGYIDLIKFFLGHGVNVSELNDLVMIGPVLRMLVDKLTFKTKSGVDYSDWFPLLRQGYISDSYIETLLELYIYENNLIINFQHPTLIGGNEVIGEHNKVFLMDDTLKLILMETPALYDIEKSDHRVIHNHELIPNRANKSSIQIINQRYQDISVNSLRKFIAYDVFLTAENVGIINRYKPSDTQESFDDPQIIKQALRERILLYTLFWDYFDYGAL